MAAAGWHFWMKPTPTTTPLECESKFSRHLALVTKIPESDSFTMKLVRSLFVVIPALVSYLQAAEVVSWKAPVDDLAPEPFLAPGVIQLQYPPEESVFFQSGDELWDIRPLFAESDSAERMRIEWIIWNARSGRVTAKGEMTDLWKIHQRLRGQEQSTHTRLTLKLFDVSPDKAPPTDSTPPAATVSWLTDSDEFEVSDSTTDYLLGAKGTALMDESGAVTSVKITTNSRLANSALLTVDTAFDLDTGGSQWFARDVQNGNGMDLVLSSEAELIDGTPVNQITLIQSGTDAVNVHGELPSNRFQLPDGRWVHAAAFPLNLFSNLIETKPAGIGIDNPFAATSEGASEWRPVGDLLKKQFPKLATIAPPAELRATIPYDLLDFRPWLQQHSPSAIEESSFIAYDPLAERVIAISSDQTDGMDEFDRYFSTLDQAKTPQIVVSLEGGGECRLLGISGLSSSITRTQANDIRTRFLELSPTFGLENPIELGLEYDSGKTESDQILRIKTKLHLQPERPIQVLGSLSKEGAGTGIRVECKILDPEIR